jgi:hypothetical protein
MVSFKLLSLYPRDPLGKGLGRTHKRSGRGEEERTSWLYRDRSPVVQSIGSHWALSWATQLFRSRREGNIKTDLKETGLWSGFNWMSRDYVLYAEVSVGTSCILFVVRPPTPVKPVLLFPLPHDRGLPCSVMFGTGDLRVGVCWVVCCCVLLASGCTCF